MRLSRAPVEFLCRRHRYGKGRPSPAWRTLRGQARLQLGLPDWDSGLPRESSAPRERIPLTSEF